MSDKEVSRGSKQGRADVGDLVTRPTTPDRSSGVAGRNMADRHFVVVVTAWKATTITIVVIVTAGVGEPANHQGGQNQKR